MAWILEVKNDCGASYRLVNKELATEEVSRTNMQYSHGVAPATLFYSSDQEVIFDIQSGSLLFEMQSWK